MVSILLSGYPGTSGIPLREEVRNWGSRVYLSTQDIYVPDRKWEGSVLDEQDLASLGGSAQHQRALTRAEKAFLRSLRHGS